MNLQVVLWVLGMSSSRLQDYSAFLTTEQISPAPILISDHFYLLTFLQGELLLFMGRDRVSYIPA